MACGIASPPVASKRDVTTDYKTVSVLLGHASVSTTLNLYVHPNMEQKKRCIDRVMKSLGK